jgi:membrane protease YdiL (CAAX protease family)
MDRRTVLRSVAAIEGTSLALAILLGRLLGVAWWRQLELEPIALVGVGIGLVTPLLSLGSVLWLRRHGFPRLNGYIDTLLIPALRPLRPVDVVALSLASGLCEELLFRAALQPVLGLTGASLLFGVLHTGARELASMGIWATLAGFGLGALLLATGSIWCVILCHATHNFVTVCWLRASSDPG